MATSVWKGHLTFGLVSLPVRLFSAARAESVSFNLLHKSDNSRIKQVTFCQAEDKPIPRSDLVKGYEYEKDRYVVIEDDEIKKVAPKTAKVMEILEFVETKDIDPVYLESSYYMAPEGGGEKAYALLFEALRKSGYSGVAKIAMHNREHIVILRPAANELMLHTLFFANEVQRVDVEVGPPKFSDKELRLASQLIDTLSGKFQPEKFQDEYQKNVEQLIEQKQKGERVHAPKYERPRPAVDILKALQQSLAKSKATPKQTAPARSRKRKAA